MEAGRERGWLRREKGAKKGNVLKHTKCYVCFYTEKANCYVRLCYRCCPLQCRNNTQRKKHGKQLVAQPPYKNVLTEDTVQETGVKTS